jgi:hypothetical protein
VSEINVIQDHGAGQREREKKDRDKIKYDII